MAKLTLVINGMNRAQHALADALRSAGLGMRIWDLCGEPEVGYPGAERIEGFDRPIRAIPTLLIDSDDGHREIARQEGAAIDAGVVTARLADGTYRSADAGAPAIRRPEEEPEPGAASLARIKSGQGTLADVIAFLAARF